MSDETATMRQLREENDQLRRELAEIVERIPHEIEFERVHFIRDAVQLLYVYGLRHEQRMQPADAWARARELWDAKPEDC